MPRARRGHPQSQLLIDELVADVRSAAADAEIDVDLERVADRRALHAALNVLIEHGVLHERDSDGGGLGRWAEDTTARSLLDVDRDRLQLMLAAPLSSVGSPEEMLEQMVLPSAAGGARVTVRRLLAESPLLSTDDLTPDQAEWWRRNRNRERDRLGDLFGLEVELRAEGAAAIDPEDDLSDLKFPGPGTTKRLALLVVDRLVAGARTRATGGDRTLTTVPLVEVRAAFDTVAADFAQALTKAYAASLEALVRDVTDLLVLMSLVRVTDSGDWVLHAAAARYVPRAELVTGEQASLFDDDGGGTLS